MSSGAIRARTPDAGSAAPGGRGRARRSVGSATTRAGARRTRRGRRPPTGCPRRAARPVLVRPSARRRGATRRTGPPSREPAPSSSPSRCEQPRLDEAALLASVDERVDRARRASRAPIRLLVLDDAGAHAHHLRQRPERDALAVGEAAAAVPPDVFGETVDVLVELPAEPRLADAGDAHDGDEMRAAARRRDAWKSSLTRRSSRSRPTNGGSSPADLSAPPQPRSDAQSLPERTGSSFPLSSCVPASA